MVSVSMFSLTCQHHTWPCFPFPAPKDVRYLFPQLLDWGTSVLTLSTNIGYEGLVYLAIQTSTAQIDFYKIESCQILFSPPEKTAWEHGRQVFVEEGG